VIVEPSKGPSEFQKQAARIPLYVRLGWGALLLFGMVGNCAKPGSPGPVYIFILVGIMWACIRAMTEAIDAYRVLMLVRAHDNEKKAPPKKDDDDQSTPPGPPATT